MYLQVLLSKEAALLVGIWVCRRNKSSGLDPAVSIQWKELTAATTMQKPLEQ